MRIRRKIIAPAILAIGTLGSLASGPVLALTTAAAPAATGVAAAGVSPNVFVYHA